MKYNFIQYDARDRIGTLVLDRPDKRNALHAGMVTELIGAFTRMENDPGIKVIILKASGKVFSAGADLQYLEQISHNSYEENLADSRHLMDLLLAIYRLKKLVIAQVEGHAIAGGCGLATVCDLCYAVPAALFGYTEARIGFIPALVSVFLTRKIGEGKARELLLTGQLIPAEEAARIGLITAVWDSAGMGERVLETALSLCGDVSGQSVAQTKHLLSLLPGGSLTDSLDLAAEFNAKSRDTEDCHHGIRSFLAKKEIKW